MYVCTARRSEFLLSKNYMANFALCPALCSEMFNVNYFVVSQCNPYVLPLVSEWPYFSCSWGCCPAVALLCACRCTTSQCRHC